MEQLPQTIQSPLFGDIGAGVLEVLSQSQAANIKIPVRMEHLQVVRGGWMSILDLDPDILETYSGLEKKGCKGNDLSSAFWAA